MRVTEKLVKSPEEEGVTLAYIRLTKDFEEIKGKGICQNRGYSVF